MAQGIAVPFIPSAKNRVRAGLLWIGTGDGPSRLGRWMWCLLLGMALAEPGRAELPAAPLAAVHASEAGLPFIRNFGPDEYGAGTQNWAIAQDRQGVIYVGNGDDGVLAFDGTTWRRIVMPNLSTVSALAADAAGRIYVGAAGELGYLAPDASGELHYVSLLNRIAPEDRIFTDVGQIFPTDDGVYFATFTHIFRLRGNQVTVWKPATEFHFAFWARDTLLVREVDRGLMQLVGDRLVPVPGGERFATEKIYALLPWGEPAADKAGDLLIGTRTQGWFIFDGTGFRPWMTAADAALKRDRIYGAIWLADGTLAVATLQGGVSQLDDQGRWLRHLTKASGLAGDEIYALFQDRQQGLWLGGGTGVARIDLGSPITHYDERTGLEGTVLALQRHAGRLYAGTSQGLFRLDTDTKGNARFVPNTQVPGWGWAFLESDRSLLVATDLGVFEIGDDNIRPVRASEQFSLSLLRSKQQPARVFLGLQDGIASLRLEHDRWVDEGRIPGITDEVRTLFEEADGRLWLGNRNGGAIRLTFPRGWAGNSGGGPSVLVERFGSQQGLPAGFIAVYPIAGRPRFAGTSGGLLQFDESKERFVLDRRFATLFPAGSREVSPIQEDARGRVWMATADRSSSLKEAGAAVRGVNGITRWVPTPLQPLSGHDIFAIHSDRDGVMWFGGAKGLFRYDPALGVREDPQFTALVRKVTGRGGRLVIGGKLPRARPQIAYANNALRIEFAAPSFDTLEATRFQVRLEGLDPDWSAWSNESYRDYTTLPEGDYRFRVRARNVYEVASAEASYAFSILPPWYRTWWAYLGFAMLIGGALWLIVWALFWTRLQIVAARADMFEERNRIARDMHDSLAQSMAGIAMQLQAVKRAQHVAPEQLGPLLDRADVQFKLAMEESHRAIFALRPLALERHGLVTALRQIVASYPDLVTPIEFHSSGEPWSVPATVELHLFRLAQEAVANAVQHANASAITIGLDFGRKALQLEVSDNGDGMQAPTSPTGSGLGLSGMRKRVTQLGGQIEIASTPGSGTTVTVTVRRSTGSGRWRRWLLRRTHIA